MNVFQNTSDDQAMIDTQEAKIGYMPDVVVYTCIPGLGRGSGTLVLALPPLTGKF